MRVAFGLLLAAIAVLSAIILQPAHVETPKNHFHIVIVQTTEMGNR